MTRLLRSSDKIDITQYLPLFLKKILISVQYVRRVHGSMKTSVMLFSMR
nr:MAG TPA: hypothetical protein [Caudoviricetes sp.]